MRLDDDDFTLFGLAPRQALDRSELDARWRQLQGAAHPDRFAADDAQAQRLAMQWAVRINEAYQRLKDPLKRAAYLCERRGAPIDAERNTAMPADFLMQQMAWREALDEAAGAAALADIETAVDTVERSLHTGLQDDLDERGAPADAAQKVRALMFVNRFRQELERRLDALRP
jgi:molecular chaperone HscB